MAEAIDRQPLLNAHQNQLTASLDYGSSIDAKALGLLATTVAVLIFIGQARLNMEWWHMAALFAPYILSLTFNMLATYPRRYASASVDTNQHPEYLAMDNETLVLQLIADTELAITTNSKLNEQRWRQCAWAFLAALAGTLVLLLILAVQ